MKNKKRIEKLEAQVSELKTQQQTNSITLVDKSNPNCKVVLSLKDGEFLMEKVTTTSNEDTVIILKDNK